MDNNEAFLRAIADEPTDDTIRLVYADWLEERGDPHAEFLRIQQTLARQDFTEAAYLESCEREQELVRQLDPAWVGRVRRFTTAPPCRDITRLVPELAPFAQTTIRLHPRRLVGSLPPDFSKIGGLFLWSAEEPWPICLNCKVPLAPVLQLRARDVPGVSFPAGRDLLQLFWCPREESHNYEPAPRIWWRSTGALTRFRTEALDRTAFSGGARGGALVPFASSVYPERVVEYPVGDDLYALAGVEQAARIQEILENRDIDWGEDLAERYASEHGPSSLQDLAFSELSYCPSTKVGGKPGFQKDGLQFDHLVTLSTCEFDSGSFRRWLPVEDQRLFAPPGRPLTWNRLYRECAFQPLQEATGMRLGRTQRAHVYVCRDREPWEVCAYIGD